jgi:hypothetical protein
MAHNGFLRFFYFNQLADTAAAVTVTDLSEKNNTDEVKFRLNITRGENYIQKDIRKLMKIEEGHLYMLALENAAAEKWYIMFEIKKY